MAEKVVIQTDMKVTGAIKWNMRIKYTYWHMMVCTAFLKQLTHTHCHNVQQIKKKVLLQHSMSFGHTGAESLVISTVAVCPSLPLCLCHRDDQSHLPPVISLIFLTCFPCVGLFFVSELLFLVLFWMFFQLRVWFNGVQVFCVWFIPLLTLSRDRV